MCGSSLINTESPMDLVAGLSVFRNIAEHHRFMLLLETTDWVLKGACIS